MKKIVVLIAAAVAILTAACSREKAKEILAKEIVYDVVINNQKVIWEAGSEGASYSWFFSNIEASRRCHFLESLFAKVITDTVSKDTLRITDDKGDKLAVDYFKQRLIVYDSVKYHPPYLVCDTLIASIIGPEDIFTLRFKEKWTYDPQTMEITKKIIAYAPLFFPNDPARPGKRVIKPVPLFWMQQDTNAVYGTLLTDKILSTVPFNDPPDFINPDSANFAQYMNALSQFVYGDSIPACMWDNASKTDIRARESIWRARLLPTKRQASIDSIVPGIYWQVFFGEKNVNREDPLYKNAVRAGLHFAPVNGICFIEQWYFDPVSLQLGKKVSHIGGVTLKRNYRGDIKGYNPSFVVNFNRLAAPPKAKLVKKEQGEGEEKK